MAGKKKKKKHDPATQSHHDIFFSAAQQIIRKNLLFLYSPCLLLLPLCSVTHCLRSVGCKSMSDTFPLVGRLFNYNSSRYLNLDNLLNISPLNNAYTELIRFCVVIFLLTHCSVRLFQTCFLFKRQKATNLFNSHILSGLGSHN